MTTLEVLCIYKATLYFFVHGVFVWAAQEAKMAFINKLFLIYFLLPAMVIASNLATTQVEKLLMGHINASGGERVLMQMQSISRYGKISFYEQGYFKESYCYHTDIVYPKKLREQIKGKNIEYDRGTDGVSFWLWTGSQYEFTGDKELISYMRSTAERANRDLLWIMKQSKDFEMVTNTPLWAPSNSQCIQVIHAENSIKRTHCFDITTGLLNAFGSSDEYRIESDWREINNIKLPFKLTHYQNGVIVYEVQLDYVKLNDFIPDTQFLKPPFPQLSCLP